MEQQINHILEDLYILEPEFKKDEAKLKVLLEALLKAKPEVKIDGEFVKNLRQMLMARATILQEEKNNNSIFMKKLNFVLGGALMVLAAIFGVQYVEKNKQPQHQVTQLLSSSLEINKVPNANAFGDLSALALNTRNQSGGGGGGASLPANQTEPKMMAGMGGGPQTDIMPIYKPYTFVYKGGELPELIGEQSVLKYSPAAFSQGATAEFIKNFSLGLVDINKFAQGKLQNFTINEDREFGYSLNVDLNMAGVNIYQNWEKWPHPESSCTNEDCFAQYRVKIQDFPDDATLIGIANSFLKDYGVSLSGFGQPIVSNDWKADYENSSDKSNYYIPESANVIYPYVINNQTVLDEGGNPTGLSVTVDIRNKKVSNLYGLTSRRFDESSYQGETSKDRIIQIAEKGGWRSYLPLAEQNSPDKQIVELGTPTLELIQTWWGNDGTSSQLFVPALVFPVTKSPNSPEMYIPKKVIVPLVKELLDSQNTNPVIMDRAH